MNTSAAPVLSRDDRLNIAKLMLAQSLGSRRVEAYEINNLIENYKDRVESVSDIHAAATRRAAVFNSQGKIDVEEFIKQRRRDLSKIKKLADVESIRFLGGKWLVVATRVIPVTYEDGSYELGRFDICINLTALDDTLLRHGIRLINKDFYYGDIGAPCICEHRGCWGNLAEDLTTSFLKGDYYELIKDLISFVKSPNDENGYCSHQNFDNHRKSCDTSAERVLDEYHSDDSGGIALERLADALGADIPAGIQMPRLSKDIQLAPPDPVVYDRGSVVTTTAPQVAHITVTPSMVLNSNTSGRMADIGYLEAGLQMAAIGITGVFRHLIPCLKDDRESEFLTGQLLIEHCFNEGDPWVALNARVVLRLGDHGPSVDRVERIIIPIQDGWTVDLSEDSIKGSVALNENVRIEIKRADYFGIFHDWSSPFSSSVSLAASDF